MLARTAARLLRPTAANERLRLRRAGRGILLGMHRLGQLGTFIIILAAIAAAIYLMVGGRKKP